MNSEVAQIIGGQFVAQVSEILLVLFEPCMFPIGAEDMLAVLDALQDGLEFAVDPIAVTACEHTANFNAGDTPQAQFTTTLEQFSDGMISFENEIVTVLHLME